MAEILIKAQNNSHPDAEKSRRGCWKRGYPVVVMPDGHPWGKEEGLPKFYILKVPLISVDKIRKYITPQYVTDSSEEGKAIYRRRCWKFRLDDMPLLAKTKLDLTGMLTIKATDAYTGLYDYTWSDVKAYLRNQETGQDETENP